MGFLTRIFGPKRGKSGEGVRSDLKFLWRFFITTIIIMLVLIIIVHLQAALEQRLLTGGNLLSESRQSIVSMEVLYHDDDHLQCH